MQISAKRDSSKQFNYLLLVLTSIHIAAGAFFAYGRYSGVPHWDSWEAMLGFMNNHQQEDFFYWFSQHYEHRIFITRVLFWIDYVLFNGNNLFLIILNYVFTAIYCLLSIIMVKDIFANKNLSNIGDSDTSKFSRNYLMSLVVIFSFSQLQNENLNWEFQSQFILAYLIPILSFYFLGKYSADSKNSSTAFVLSCIFGILSAGTMANGVLALPAATIMALTLRLKRDKILILLGLSIAILLLYFHDYHKPEKHTSIEALFDYPFEITIYLITYLGSAFEFMLEFQDVLLLGTLFLALSTRSVWRMITGKEKNWTNIALTIFLSYIVLSGAITAVGRIAGSYIPLNSEMLDAFPSPPNSGRYKTPTLMGWLTIIILYSNAITRFIRICKANKYIALIVPLYFITYQILILDMRYAGKIIFEKQVSVLSLELGIKDEKQITKKEALIHGYISWMDNVKKASDSNISIFNDDLIRDVKQEIGKRTVNKKDISIRSYIHCTDTSIIKAKVRKISGEGTFRKIEGLLTEENAVDKGAGSLYIINDIDKVAGYAIIHKDSGKFKGYINSKERCR